MTENIGRKPGPSIFWPVKADRVSARVVSPVPLKEAALNYTIDTGDWQKRRWNTIPAQMSRHTISASLPQQRPLVWFLSATDERGLRVSTEHEELAFEIVARRAE